MSTQPAIYRLEYSTQSYDWGKLGSESKVAAYAAGIDGFVVDNNKPYAELWMGTHPNGPSYVLSPDGTKRLLKEVIAADRSLVTPELYKSYDGDLPFLFKVLSIRKALSIQAHPDKILGAELFEKFPHLYKDPNHKPEMALALTPFEALCGFRPLEEITAHLANYPELTALVGTDVATTFRNTVSSRVDPSDLDALAENRLALRTLFSALLTSPPTRVTENLAALVQRIKAEGTELRIGSVPELVVRLDGQYPGGDVGVFAVMLLNYIKLQPGQAIFLGANEPHAYLSGDCIECMAASDNVVRAGLTPKFKDVNVLLDMLTYRYGSARSQLMTGIPYQHTAHSTLYDPPIDEFSVLLTLLHPHDHEELPGVEGPSILIVTQGAGWIEPLDGEKLKIEQGQVYFVGARVGCAFRAGEEGLTMFKEHFVPRSIEKCQREQDSESENGTDWGDDWLRVGTIRQAPEHHYRIPPNVILGAPQHVSEYEFLGMCALNPVQAWLNAAQPDQRFSSNNHHFQIPQGQLTKWQVSQRT
ncbi:phosphomannose isomerase type I [Jimgerdemannia flammicorona]|uniref:Mannose-6-phosphate isomerase n=1 Tax=Jimgerdemannia flammicorona TaxID=994334 RepID=A0A433Q5E3_9FUNG|nr:phosphomannose isomerase type I [Jimgerdemannia flammicorona]